MSSQVTVTLVVPPARCEEARDALTSLAREFRTLPNARWQAFTPNGVVTFYGSGKVVVQGADPEPLLALLRPLEAQNRARGTSPELERTALRSRAGTPSKVAAAAPFGDAIAMLPDPRPTAWIGIDECGKGDYFGPLVVAAARVSVDDLPWLAELGVTDSKALSDRAVMELARALQEAIPHAIVPLMPPKYNELYARIGNLNRLLAWGHATAAEELLGKCDAELILSDQFASSDIVKRSLKERGRTCRFVQRTRAESDPAVACASIFARATFLTRLHRLEKENDVALHKGAGPPVLAAGRRLVAQRGASLLPQVAKLHFKTTEQIIGRPWLEGEA